MTVIGFNLTKIAAERKKASGTSIKIGTNVNINNVEKANLSLDSKRSALKTTFTYTVAYNPDIGSIAISGEIVFLHDTTAIEAIIDEWQKKKTMTKQVSAEIVTTIMQRCVVEALLIARDLGLPAPLPLPKVKAPEVKVVPAASEPAAAPAAPAKKASKKEK